MRNLLIIITIVLLSIAAQADLSAAGYADFTGEYWYGVYMQGNKIGYASMALANTGDDQWTITQRMNMTFTVNGVPLTLQSDESRTYLGKQAQLVSSQYISSAQNAVIRLEGKTKDDVYLITTDIMGQKTETRLDLPAETLGDVLNIQKQIKDGKLAVGQQMQAMIFMADPPLTRAVLSIYTLKEIKKMVFGGVETGVYVVRDSLPELRIAGDMIYNSDGLALIQDFPSMGLQMRLEPPEMAKQIGAQYDLITENIIKAPEGPKNPAEITSASYIISGIAVETLPRNGWLTIKKLAPDSAQLTIAQKTADSYGLAIPVTESQYSEYLESTPLLQADNIEIKNLAKQIIGNEKNAFRAAQMINNWVFNNIRKEYSPDISNALQTYKLGRGDCGEHTALATTLMRAVGIPARPVGGVTYWPQGEGFAYHAWVEAYVGEWIQMDPTWDETFADATHIMLASGNLENQIIAVLGAFKNLRIKILNYN